MKATIDSEITAYMNRLSSGAEYCVGSVYKTFETQSYVFDFYMYYDYDTHKINFSLRKRKSTTRMAPFTKREHEQFRAWGDHHPCFLQGAISDVLPAPYKGRVERF